MVSLQAALAPEEQKKKKTTTSLDLENFPSKKRKCRDGEESRELFAMERERQPKLVKAMDDIELNLDFPVPLDWQRCLDIKSGQIYFYNTRTQGRTSLVEPRVSLDPLPAPHASLDLELNLTCAPPRREGEDKRKEEVCAEFCNSSNKDASGGVMVAAVCRRCHLLVVMSKATLLCPNCKFVHPPP